MPTADKELVAVLDACVLLPASVRDTLLRLAETPRLYIPKWSDGVLTELRRNLELRWNLPPKKIAHLTSQLSRHFPEACIEPDEKLILRMTNDPKDRHVLAAAVKGKAEVIVTFNLKDFPPAALRKWKIRAEHPDAFLCRLYSADPQAVVSRLREQASAIGRTLPELLNTLGVGVPHFAALIGNKQE